MIDEDDDDEIGPDTLVRSDDLLNYLNSPEFRQWLLDHQEIFPNPPDKFDITDLEPRKIH